MTTLNLTKSQPLDLTKREPGLTSVLVGLSWDPATGGQHVDLDVSAVALDATGSSYRGTEGFAFFNQKSILGGVIECGPDNRTGDGDGDDEVVTIDLARVPAEVTEIAIIASSYDGIPFGRTRNARIHIDNATTSAVIANYDLSEDSSGDVTIEAARLTRTADGWSATITEARITGGLDAVVAKYRIG